MMWSTSSWLLRLGVMASLVLCVAATEAEAEKRHPCDRECKNGEKPMTCRYHWLVENYLVLSKACFKCPFNVTDCLRQQCIMADGVPRAIRVINRQLPGPSLRVCQGDTVEVNVTNQMMMAEGLTIHWHGLQQRKSQHMDGVSMVTQCPIPAFAAFNYKYLAEDPGTHFYHSHSGLYRGEGVFGALIIRQAHSHDPQRALYDLDLPEHEVIINDWAHVAIVQMYAEFFHSNNGSQAPSNILINGRGVYPPPKDEPQNLQVPYQPPTPFARFDVSSDVRYRFRVINAGALRCPIQFSVDHHSLLMISSDGWPLKPLPVASILMFSGERYDFILHTKKELSGLHWIRVKGLDLCEEQGIQQFALLNYRDRNVTNDEAEYPDEPRDYHTPLTVKGHQFNQWYLKGSANASNEHAQIMNMSSLEPDDESLLRKVDRQIFLEFAYRFRTNLHFHDPVLYPAKGVGYKTVSSPTINNISNILPPYPLLHQSDDILPELICNSETVDQEKCSKGFCECVHRVEAREGEVVELVVYNSNDQYGYTHPVHLHGYGYRVVAADRLKTRITHQRFLELDKKGLIHRRLHEAPLKDTMPVPNGGYIILRILADNPGVWFMHCHVSLHAEIGMAVTLQVKDAKGQLPPTPPDFPRCGTWPKLRHQHHHRNDVIGNNDDNVSNENRQQDSAAAKDAWVMPAFIALASVNVVVILTALVFYAKRKRVGQSSEVSSSATESKGVRMMSSRLRHNNSDEELSSLLGC